MSAPPDRTLEVGVEVSTHPRNGTPTQRPLWVPPLSPDFGNQSVF